MGLYHRRPCDRLAQPHRKGDGRGRQHRRGVCGGHGQHRHLGAANPPTAPTIASFSNDSGVAGDGITNDNTLTLKGTAAANSTVKVFDGTTQIGTTTASSTGSWDYITSVLSNAKHVLTATATSSSGQTSAASGAMTMTVDTVAPITPVLSSNSIVNANQVKLSGTAEANSTVTIYDGTTVVGTGTTNSTGAWSVTTNALSTGTHGLTAKAADVAGNVERRVAVDQQRDQRDVAHTNAR